MTQLRRRPDSPQTLAMPGWCAEMSIIESTELLTMESYPLQFMLSIQGNLPTPCHQLARGSQSAGCGKQGGRGCVFGDKPRCHLHQVLQPFDTNVSLGSFPAGAYTLWVNGEMVAEFQS
jgi:hypothetical protein